MKDKSFTKDKVISLIISFLMAFFLWVYALSATGQTETKVYKDIPVKIINSSSLSALDLVLDNNDYDVDVKLYGSTLQLSQVRKSDLIAIIDVSTIKSVGNHSIAVTVSGLPENVSVSEINERYLSVSVSELKNVEKTVEITKAGSLQEGYFSIGEKYSSKVCVVYGNAQNIGKVVSVKGSVDVNAISEDVTRRANLAAYDESGNVVDDVNIIPSYVDVSLTVGKIKEVPVTVSTSGAVLEGYVLSEISAETETVKIAGKEDVLSGIDVIFTATADLTGRSESFSQTLSLHGEEGIVLLDEGPVKVNFVIEAKENKEVTFSTIRFLNTPTGLDCSLMEFGGITAVVSGEKRVLKDIDEGDITAFIDLSGLSEGTHEVTVQFDVPESVEIKENQEIKVKVRLENK
ncbi:MAG: hypothetical protein IKM61_09020 [Eubacteriaceae bacterium]|nr:hypothetical protein [Eubacteriaceae bacterium]